MRKATRCRHNIAHSFLLAAMILLYAPSHKQDSKYQALSYTSRAVWLERDKQKRRRNQSLNKRY